MYICVCIYIYIHIYIYIYVNITHATIETSSFIFRRRTTNSCLEARLQRHINGVVSNGVVPKSQICKLVAKPAPDIFRIQGVYLLVFDLDFRVHNFGFGGIKRPF